MRLLDCPHCDKTGLKGERGLAAHISAKHPPSRTKQTKPKVPEVYASTETMELTVRVPKLPEGEHEIDCPVCKSPTTIRVDRSDDIEQQKTRKFPRTIVEHPIFVRERMIQRRDKKTVVMVGTHSRTFPKTPWREVGIDEIWGLNDSHSIDKIKNNTDKFSRWFQMHHRWRFTRRVTRFAEDHWQWLQNSEVPRIYMQRKYADVPSSEKYPLREVCEMFIDDKLARGAGYIHQYFTNTFSYMIALALYEKVKGINDWERIEIYGCELQQVKHEYFRQRPGLEWWLGQAAAHGIQVYVPNDTLILFAQNMLDDGQLAQYPGYMAYGYVSPSMQEALQAQEVVGVDPVEENLIGAWEDYHPHFVKSLNDSLFRIQKATVQSDEELLALAEFEQWLYEEGARPS